MNISRQCPFCKNIISGHALKCRECHMVVAERTRSVNSPINISYNHFGQSLNNIVNSLKFQINSILKVLGHLKKYKPTFNLNYLGLIPIIALFLLSKSGSNGNTTNSTTSLSNTPYSSTTILSANYNRLANGQVISSSIHNQANLGSLEIDNGTESDSIAKLVDIKLNRSVTTVSIQANSKYTINNIPDSEYRLYFQTGKDWDEESKKFAYNPSYSKFSESFSYLTKTIAGSATYTTYQITLNPVVGGTATTDTINESEFEKF